MCDGVSLYSGVFVCDEIHCTVGCVCDEFHCTVGCPCVMSFTVQWGVRV